MNRRSSGGFAQKVKSDIDLISVLQSIKLQNLSNDFTKPNILDIKLGTQLYAEDAPPEKKERMIQVAMKTTSLETGIRMTGFQVCLRSNTTLPRPLSLITLGAGVRCANTRICYHAKVLREVNHFFPTS